MNNEPENKKARNIVFLIVVIVLVTAVPAGAAFYFYKSANSDPSDPKESLISETPVVTDNLSENIKSSPSCDENVGKPPEEVLECICDGLRSGNDEQVLRFYDPYSTRFKEALGIISSDSKTLLAETICENSKKEYEDNGSIKYSGFLTTPDGEKVEDSFWVSEYGGSWYMEGL